MSEFDAKMWADGHEKLCAARYANIDRQLGQITKIGGWAGALAVMIMVSLLGWSLKAGYDREQIDMAQFRATGAQITATVKSAVQPAQPQGN